MAKVFISYRRETAAGDARALCTSVAAHLGRESVLIDVDSLSVGRDFRKELRKVLASCDYMLVVIDSQWIDAKDAAGNRRLDNPGDYVRQEVEAGLERDIAVAPVLLNGGKLPEIEKLPHSLKELVYRGAFEVSHSRWESDVEEMLRRVGLIAVKTVTSPVQQPVPQAAPQPPADSSGPTSIITKIAVGFFWVTCFFVVLRICSGNF
jgi:hypothetical protein